MSWVGATTKTFAPGGKHPRVVIAKTKSMALSYGVKCYDILISLGMAPGL